MFTIQDIINKYSKKIDFLDLEILIADSLNKTREFVLSNPEHEISKTKNQKLKTNIARRAICEPLAYILGHKEFYGLDFIVNKNTLIPRPETEQIVELVIAELQQTKNQKPKTAVIDIGTGSGNIIISIAKNVKDVNFIGTDISAEALKVANKNATMHKVNKKIKFLHGSLLTPLIENCKLKIENSTMIIVANLPYLSKEIYSSAPKDVKKFEPKSALYSAKDGLAHYEKLLEQIKQLMVISHKLSVISYFEISPEQKLPLTKIIKAILPTAKIEFNKDLSGRWRVCKIIL